MPKRITATLALLLLAACATNPATGQRQLMLMSAAQEIELGRQADGQIGGAYGLVEDPRLQASSPASAPLSPLPANGRSCRGPSASWTMRPSTPSPCPAASST